MILIPGLQKKCVLLPRWHPLKKFSNTPVSDRDPEILAVEMDMSDRWASIQSILSQDCHAGAIFGQDLVATDFSRTIESCVAASKGEPELEPAKKFL